MKLTRSTRKGKVLLNKVVEFVKKNPTYFKPYERLMSSLGLFSTPFVLMMVTIFIAFEGIPGIFLPSIIDLTSFAAMIISAVVGLVIHEFSHMIVLVNHGVSNVSIGVSMRGVWGWFIKADVEEDRCKQLILPFYSVGLGSNMFLFLTFMLFQNINPHLHMVSIVNFWLLFINGMPAPLIDGGRLFELILTKLKMEKFMEPISICIMFVWILILISRFV